MNHTSSAKQTNQYLIKRLTDDVVELKKELEEKKPVVFCGDLNVAHKEIDLKNPKTNRRNAFIYQRTY